MKHILTLALALLLAGLLPAAPKTTTLGEHPVPLDAGWRAQNAGLVSPTSAGETLHLDINAFPGRWQVIAGPEITLGARTEFFKNRRCQISIELKAAGLESYAMQVRLRQRSGAQAGGGAFTRSLSPRQEWDAAAEVVNAEKLGNWSVLEGAVTINPDTERLAVEIWVASPHGAAPATLDIRNFKLTEQAEIGHVFAPVPAAKGNLFFSDTGGMSARLYRPDDVTASRMELFDETGRSLGKVDGVPGASTMDIILPGIGYYKVLAAATYRDGTSIESETTAAVLGQPLDEKVRLNSRLGSVRVWGDGELWRKSGSNWDWGIGRIDLSGYTLAADGSISPPPGAAPLGYPADHKNIYTIGAFPKWVMPDNYARGSLMAPKDWQLFERLLEAFARHNPDLSWFCPYNEPDAHWRGTTEDFVKFHRVIAAGVKKGNPNMKLYGPCLYSIRMDDIRKYDALGLFDCFDGLVMHTYVDGTEPEGQFIERVAAFVKYLKDTGRGDMPVFVTEFGWCAEIGDWQKTIGELERSQYAPRSIALLAAQPLDAIEYFVFKHISKPGKPGYSMLYSDDTPTPTYVAYVNTLHWLSWTQRGDGRRFAFSPRLNFTLFHNHDRDTGVAWNTDGPARLTLPWAPSRMTDSLGRPLPVEGASLAVGPAPVFFELPDSRALFDAKTLPAKAVAPGTRVKLPWPGSLAAPEMTLEGDQAVIAADATSGDYSVLGKVGDAYEVQPIRVLAPLSVEGPDFTLSPNGRRLIATTRVESPISEEVRVTVRITLDDGTVAETKANLKPNRVSRVGVAIPGFEPGRRYQGKLTAFLEGNIVGRFEKDIDQTYLFCPVVSTVDWSAIPAVDISGWNPFPTALAPSDCSARFKTAVTAEGFRLFVEVADDVHDQTQTPANLWNGDSIQFAFDVDADKEWQPNNVGNGYNGHRIFEYGVALSSADRQPLVWRWRADAPGFTAASEEPRILARLGRQGNVTRYDITLPWPVLGLSAPPAPGSNLGFSLVVNDLDGGNDKRHGLRIFGGISESKNPEKFGKLHVTDSGEPR